MIYKIRDSRLDQSESEMQVMEDTTRRALYAAWHDFSNLDDPPDPEKIKITVRFERLARSSANVLDPDHPHLRAHLRLTKLGFAE